MTTAVVCASCCVEYCYNRYDCHGEENVVQLVECWTSTPLRQVWFPVRPGIFLPESTFSADSLMVSVHPHVQPHALSPCQSSVDYGNTKTSNMDHRLGSMTVAAGFLQGKQPEFTTGEIQRDNTVVKKQKWQLPWFSTLLCTSLVWIVWNLLSVMGKQTDLRPGWKNKNKKGIIFNTCASKLALLSCSTTLTLSAHCSAVAGFSFNSFT